MLQLDVTSDHVFAFNEIPVLFKVVVFSISIRHDIAICILYTSTLLLLVGRIKFRYQFVGVNLLLALIFENASPRKTKFLLFCFSNFNSCIGS